MARTSGFYIKVTQHVRSIVVIWVKFFQAELIHNELPEIQFYADVHNIHMEGTVSQIFYLGLSSDFI